MFNFLEAFKRKSKKVERELNACPSCHKNTIEVTRPTENTLQQICSNGGCEWRGPLCATFPSSAAYYEVDKRRREQKGF